MLLVGENLLFCVKRVYFIANEMLSPFKKVLVRQNLNALRQIEAFFGEKTSSIVIYFRQVAITPHAKVDPGLSYKVEEIGLI